MVRRASSVVDSTIRVALDLVGGAPDGELPLVVL